MAFSRKLPHGHVGHCEPDRQAKRIQASTVTRYSSAPNSNCHVFVFHCLLLLILTEAHCCCASVLCAAPKCRLPHRSCLTPGTPSPCIYDSNGATPIATFDYVLSAQLRCPQWRSRTSSSSTTPTATTPLRTRSSPLERPTHTSTYFTRTSAAGSCSEYLSSLRKHFGTSASTPHHGRMPDSSPRPSTSQTLKYLIQVGYGIGRAGMWI